MFQRWLGRGVTSLFLTGLAIVGTIYFTRDLLPGVWQDFRCLPSHLRQERLPYLTFVQWVKAGHVRRVFFNSEQAQAYFVVDEREYIVKLPELDLSWLELWDERGVQIVPLVPGSC
ncbi:hypothetical protein [Candidatus Cyanaurora vandensis]|uniref:hypothetical protein n=1 Tax=Candidatus Cyanaurora vandensis TaxID=2714958 RepID=UPI00257FE8F5|nr:hypothetical protein [Candidatus Cyanaurora vandensis]